MPGKHYSEFVEEAFIAPIRSVLIVDDDYPTFDEMLSAEIDRAQHKEPPRTKSWYSRPERIKKVISRFREPQRPLLVDIHDGSNVTSGEEIEIASHLHQSDLLVLDFELDKTKEHDGTLAIEIVRRLTKNNHFNLVVVHTSEKLDLVFRQVLFALLGVRGEFSDGANKERAQALLFKLDGLNDEDAAGDKAELVTELMTSVGVDEYLYARLIGDKYIDAVIAGRGAFARFKQAADGLGLAKGELKVLARHFLSEIEAKVSEELSEKTIARSWSGDAIKYIACDSVFVAFSEKGDDDDLLADLLASLNVWKPQPSHLFLAKLRAEMDERGVLAQEAVLSNRHALAHWYHRLLEADGEKRRWMISESVARHSEQLLAGILPEVDRFATRLVGKESGSGPALDICDAHFKVDLANEKEKLLSEREHNAYVSSKAPTGWHLTTGHVFMVGDEYWVCVSPACDTVPSQLSSAKIDVYGDRLPFMAVKLHPVKKEKKIEDVQTNRYIFLRLDGEVRAFCYNDPSSDDAAPSWYNLLADNKGVFGKNFAFKVFLPKRTSRKVTYSVETARVVSQLRYEYALNFVQRLGGTMTRIGLDYV
ncbi:response regulator receiver domain [Caulobacter segnis]|uniref:response regulator receiver domain n=1 Tax=Caulobacter segnis TaxID=88688 RepID=UPI00240FCCD7|nr:response regulator receiver domain [Caulobacter segnis]MDG2521209.1 response regulator receiver domain [Caulobacter segnis]